MKKHMKQLFSLVLAAAMVLPLFCIAPAFAAEETAAAMSSTHTHTFTFEPETVRYWRTVCVNSGSPDTHDL